MRHTLTNIWLLVKVFLIAPALFFLGLIFVLHVGDMMANNYSLNKIHASFTKIVHPSNSTVLLEKAVVGSFVELDYCAYEVGEFRKLRQSREFVQKFYEELHVTGTDGKLFPLEITFLDDIRADESYTPEKEWAAALPILEGNNMTNYFVFVKVRGGSKGYDYRCS
jgi:hypothetical protein